LAVIRGVCAERKLSLAQTPLIAASQAGAGTHPNNPGLGSAPSWAGKWFSAESHPSLHLVILTNYRNCLLTRLVDLPHNESNRKIPAAVLLSLGMWKV